MNYKEREEYIKSLLDTTFLNTLTEFGKHVGWSLDYCEIKEFIKEAYIMADIVPPNEEELKPYEREDD